MRDLYNNVKSSPSILPQVVTSAIGGGTGVSVQGYEMVKAVLAAGLQAGTSITVKLQESDTDVDGNYTDVALADMLGEAGASAGDPIVITTANDNQIHERGYIGTKKFVRWNVSAHVAGNIPISGHFELSGKRHGGVR